MVDEALDDLEDEDIDRLSRRTIEESEDLLDVANKAPIIKLVNMVLFQALKMRASDIHIQPYRRPRCRSATGSTASSTTWRSSPKKVQDADHLAASRSWGRWTSPSAACRRTAAPRSGSATARSTCASRRVPTQHGERIVMRLLDKTAKRLQARRDRARRARTCEIVQRYIHYTHGIIFVTGPTGSGKTTTLYAALAEINSAEKLNILTIEDPIEYNLDGISQVQVNEQEGPDLRRRPALASCARTPT